jgi:hypothetical protein
MAIPDRPHRNTKETRSIRTFFTFIAFPLIFIKKDYLNQTS